MNVGLFASDENWYELFSEQVTAEKVKKHFQGLVKGEVIRHDVPAIHAFNFILKDALNGGGSTSIRVDNLGKCFGTNLLRMKIEVPKELLSHIE